MKKEDWPNFPYSHWTSVKKWNISSLRLIASRLEEKTSFLRQRSSTGYQGSMTNMEQQMYQHISDLEQQVFELEDALQALLQIIDDNRPSQRIRRTFRWMSKGINRLKESLQQSTIYWILGLLGVLITLYAVAQYVFHFFRK
jgi:hypothetical protein